MPPKKKPNIATQCVTNGSKKRKLEDQLIKIQASGADGRSIDLDVAITSRFLRVKELIAEAWGVPPSCLELLCGNKRVSDSILVRAHCGNTARKTLAISVVHTIENLCKQLKDTRAATILRSLEDLGRLGLKGGDASVQAVCGCLLNDQERIRDAALSTLRAVVQKNSQSTVNEILTLIDIVNNDRGVYGPSRKNTVLTALPIIADDGNHLLIDSLIGRLGAYSFEAAHLALRARLDNSYAVDALVAASLEAKGNWWAIFFDVSWPGSEAFSERITLKLVKAVIPHLRRDSTDIQRRVLDLLSLIGEHFFQYMTDESIHNGLNPSFEHFNQQTRIGYEDLVKSFIDYINRSATELKSCALRAMRNIAVRNDDRLRLQILSWLEDFDCASTKEQGLRLLGVCARKGDERAVLAASAYLTDRSQELRTASLALLVQVMDYSSDTLHFPCRTRASL